MKTKTFSDKTKLAVGPGTSDFNSELIGICLLRLRLYATYKRMLY